MVSAARPNIHICILHNVQYDIIITRVFVMSMKIPVTWLAVYLNIAHPHGSTYLHLGIEEVRACIMVVQSDINNLNVLSCGSDQSVER